MCPGDPSWGLLPGDPRERPDMLLSKSRGPGEPGGGPVPGGNKFKDFDCISMDE